MNGAGAAQLSTMFRSWGSAEHSLALAVSFRALALLVALMLSLIGLAAWHEGISRHDPAPVSPRIDPTVVSPWIQAGGEHWYVP